MSILLALLLAFAPTVKAPTGGTPEERAFKPPTASVPDKETARAEAAFDGGKAELAIEECKRALAVNERHVPAMVVLAKAYYQLKKLELASAILDGAAVIDPRNADVAIVRGFILLAGEDQPGAIAQFKLATELDKGHAAAWNNLGAQYLVTKSYDGARNARESALALAPKFAKAHLNLGSALRGKKEYTRAEAAYLKALALDGLLADALFNLGILYLDADPFPGLEPVARLEKAIHYLQQYRSTMGARLAKDDPVSGYLTEAQKSLARQRKLEERKKKQQGDKTTPKAEKPAEKPAEK
jgi:tetratricopeptide (TPR) repeat protein